ncbi:Aspartic proteinase CDR1 [Sesamum alatum]|uniref:Aspartic proteinase CDR1 n=1 Tax=Sesamum alatum TaxID=300844 RepID=A0AAE1XM72_9LAMI|nr:Aspartic proteinase CDR1 [Sesamum alatum]
MARAMRLQSISLACLALILVISMPRFHVSEAAGFSIDLIHRDSLRSPSLDSLQRVTNSLQRSFNRVNVLAQDQYYSQQSASTEIVPDKGEYLMKFSLGTPPVQTLAIADTGSDLTWIQCKPCDRCFKQKAPFFDPKSSSTYKPVSCSSKTCNDALLRTSCNGSKSACNYAIYYGDRSFSKGDLATETITLGSTTRANVSIPNVIIGCGHLDQGTFGVDASGIVGLGGGKVSLITQMGSSIQGKFSYCLVPFFGHKTVKPSKMSFGDQAVVSGAGVASTPIVARSPKTFYFLTLEGITVGNQRLDLDLDLSSSSLNDSKPASDQEGNIIIDSGTTLTFLPSELYDKVIGSVKRQTKLREISDPQGLLNLCYRSTENVAKVPKITVHFRGADVELKPINTFVKTSSVSLCLAFAPADGLAIYGNLAQMDFLVGYDLDKKTVSFKPTDCSKA